MERKKDGKLRILYVKDIVTAHTSKKAPVSMAEILLLLELKGIGAERKSVYDDIRQLERYGLKIGRVYGGRYSGYYWIPQ